MQSVLLHKASRWDKCAKILLANIAKRNNTLIKTQIMNKFYTCILLYFKQILQVCVSLCCWLFSAYLFSFDVKNATSNMETDLIFHFLVKKMLQKYRKLKSFHVNQIIILKGQEQQSWRKMKCFDTMHSSDHTKHKYISLFSTKIRSLDLLARKWVS